MRKLQPLPSSILPKIKKENLKNFERKQGKLHTGRAKRI